MNWDEAAVMLAVATVLCSACVYVAVSLSKVTLLLRELIHEMRGQRQLIIQLIGRAGK